VGVTKNIVMARKKTTKTFLQLGPTGKRILGELTGPGTDPLEVYFLEALARTLEIAADADKLMKANGMVQTFETGARNVTPEWAVYRNAIKDAQALAKDLAKIRESLGVNSDAAEEIKADNIYSIAGLG